jgi:hypothetical protein
MFAEEMQGGDTFVRLFVCEWAARGVGWTFVCFIILITRERVIVCDCPSMIAIMCTRP